jgi:hypothetical protein
MYVISAVIKENSPLFSKVLNIYGNELQEFKLKAMNENEVTKVLAFTYVNEVKKVYSLDERDLKVINSIGLEDLEYIISLT